MTHIFDDFFTHVAQATVAAAYAVLGVLYVVRSRNTGSYTKRVVRALTSVVVAYWSAYYLYVAFVEHAPVWSSRVGHGLIIGLLTYQLWLMVVADRHA